MSFSHEAIAACPVSTDADKALIRALCTRRFAYALSTSESVTDFVAVDPATGVVPLYLIQNSTLFAYDSTDTTTVHDGVTCLVSNDGKRFKSETIAPPFSVLTFGTSAQPASPSVGDRYVIPVAATGADWAGQDGKVGIYTAGGWRFAISPIGRFIYAEDNATFYHRNAAGTWVAGVGAVTVGAASVPLSAIINAARYVLVQNQTTNTPPASPVVPEAYVIGPSPTGAWAGNAGNIAICEVNGTFTIYGPSSGWKIYDRGTGVEYTYSGSAWVSSFGGMLASKIGGYTAATTVTSGGSGNYTYSSSTPPTTSQVYNQDSRTLDYAAKAAGNILIFHYSFEMIGGGISTGNAVLALFRDSVANALDWRFIETTVANKFYGTFQLATAAADALSHTYKMRIVNISSGSYSGFVSRLFRVEEYSA